MFGFMRKSLSIPTAQEAMAGRDHAIPTAATHFVTHAPLKGPYPQGSEKALFGLGCFWGAERKFWQLPGVLVTAVAMRAGRRPIRPMTRCAPERPGTPRPCSWCSTPARSPTKTS